MRQTSVYFRFFKYSLFSWLNPRTMRTFTIEIIYDWNRKCPQFEHCIIEHHKCSQQEFDTVCVCVCVCECVCIQHTHTYTYMGGLRDACIFVTNINKNV